jgi:hypothetical protein
MAADPLARKPSTGRGNVPRARLHSVHMRQRKATRAKEAATENKQSCQFVTVGHLISFHVSGIHAGL